MGKNTKGFDSDNSGSNLIYDAITRDDPRPLYILAWGAQTNEAIALKKLVQNGKKKMADKLRLIAIGPWNTHNGDKPVNNYIRDTFKDTKMKYVMIRQSFRGMYVGGDQSGDWGNSSFVKKHVYGHGRLGDAYPKKRY